MIKNQNYKILKNQAYLKNFDFLVLPQFWKILPPAMLCMACPLKGA